MNIVSGFLPSIAIVESFYVPFYCDGCDTESLLLVHRGEDYAPKTPETEAFVNVTSPRPCEDCGGSKEMDVLPDKYFSFIKKGQN